MNPTTKREGDPALAIGPDGSHSRTRLTHIHSHVVPTQNNLGGGTFFMHLHEHTHNDGDVAAEHLSHVHVPIGGSWEVKTDKGMEADIERRYAPADLPLRRVTLDKRSPNDRETERMYKNFRRRWAVQS